MRRGTVFADGGVRGNGRADALSACAAVLYVDGEPTRQDSKLLGYGTNNTSEFHGLLMAMRLAAQFEVTHLKVRLDSMLVVEQVLGGWKVKERSLLPLRDEARRYAGKWFEEVEIKHVPREENAEADRICRLVLDRAVDRLPSSR